MRIDHHAFQRATRVAGIGLLTQLALGLTLLVFGLSADDTLFFFGAIPVLLGGLVWLGLVILFNQHKLERLEALEEDELAAGRGTESVFETDRGDVRVAARRLAFVNRWIMPGLSLLLAAALGVLAWRLFVHMIAVGKGEREFLRTEHPGWAVAISLAFAAACFIFSRFVAGMAKQHVWQNLRGGAAYVVGSSIVTLAIAIGVGFRFFGNESIVEGVAWGIPIFMCAIGAEIVLNFILNLYRPRIPGETARPAFDSKLLSLFAAPDNLVRSINEAVNYQFGFDVASSWGYRLLLRSFAWLVTLGLLALLALNAMVIVEPGQQGVLVARGRLTSDRVHDSGIMWKLPWPFQSAEVYDVDAIRTLPLTAKRVAKLDEPRLWQKGLTGVYDREIDRFAVRTSALERDAIALAEDLEIDVAAPDEAPITEESERLSREVALVDAEIALRYRIRASNDGLLDWLAFCGDEIDRRAGLTEREQALRSIALRDVTLHLAAIELDDLLTTRRSALAEELRDRIQKSFDAQRAGIDVVAADILLLQPAGEADSAHPSEDIALSWQHRALAIERANGQANGQLAQLVGDPERVEPVLAALDELADLRERLASDDEETIAKRLEVEAILVAGRGFAARMLAEAERDRSVRVMQARADAFRVSGQLEGYRAAPRLYRERERMLVYASALPERTKYVLGIDPSRVKFDIDLQELTSLFTISDAFSREGEEKPQQ